MKFCPKIEFAWEEKEEEEEEQEEEQEEEKLLWFEISLQHCYKVTNDLSL